MTVANDQHQIRPLFVAAVLLSIFIAGCLFTGAPLANAQAQDTPTVDERLQNIEEMLDILIDAQDDMREDLDDMQENLENMHSTYVTKEIFDLNISNLNNTNNIHSTLLIGIFLLVFAPYVSPSLSRRREKENESKKSD